MWDGTGLGGEGEEEKQAGDEVSRLGQSQEFRVREKPGAGGAGP